MWDNAVVDIYGFASTFAADATLPGKTLYANEGDTVILSDMSRWDKTDRIQLE